MPLTTLTTKGQVTIPKSIRDSLKLSTGDKIEITIIKKREAILRPVSKKVDDTFCKLKIPGKKPVSIEAMNQVIRKRIKEKSA